MIVLDTCALVYDSLSPERLTDRASSALEHAAARSELACSDISLWELAMLVERGRLDPGTDAETFLGLVIDARALRVLPITPAIAALSVRLDLHGDPADRIIAATSVVHGVPLITSDGALRGSAEVDTLW